jgi:hypothetical protein
MLARIGSDTSRFSAASRAKRETCCSAARSGASAGRLRATPSMIVRARCKPRMSIAPTSGSVTSPPCTTRSR